ncbi:MAG TPA: glycosyltransferase family 2 protein [Nitrososphaerales archaeon]|nr:glycosyltransferase family 2 protein [Nitrososphaerales archaeon]
MEDQGIGRGELTDRPVYSICITHYNNARTVRESMESILSQVDDRFEVVVVDNFSNDGSREILQGYASDGRIKLIERRCSRGRGRQIAFEESSGDYIISGVDLDDVFRPVFIRLLDGYRTFFEGQCLFLSGKHEAITIAPRPLVERVGGWRDVPAGEDIDLWARMAKEGKLTHVAYRRIQSKVNPHEGFFHRVTRRVDRARSAFIIGLNPLKVESDPPTIPRKIGRLLVTAAGYVAHLFHRKYKDNVEFKYKLASVHQSGLFEPPDEVREGFVRFLDRTGDESVTGATSNGEES